jgi:hypothetical protein
MPDDTEPDFGLSYLNISALHVLKESGMTVVVDYFKRNTPLICIVPLEEKHEKITEIEEILHDYSFMLTVEEVRRHVMKEKSILQAHIVIDIFGKSGTKTPDIEKE